MILCAKGITSTETPVLPNLSTTFDSSTIIINFFACSSVIFSLNKAPPFPFTQLNLPSTSSAPSIAKSSSVISDMSEIERPNSFACVLCVY